MPQETVAKGDVVLDMQDISKSFAGVKALKNVQFTLHSGEVNVLLGENGAGKSTLIKIITGAYKRDSGSMQLFGEEVDFNTPLDATRRGVSAVYQELNLIPTLSVYENIFVGSKLTKGALIKTLDRREMRKRSRALLDEIGAKFSETEIVGNLSVAQQQMVEIAKALAFDSKLIIFDEPSAVLTNREIEELMSIIRKLKERGLGIVYISHRLEEIFEIGDTVTVFRDGTFVKRLDLHTDNVSIDDIIELMVGRSLDEKFPKETFALGEEILRVEHLSSGRYFRDVSFTLRRGEILGVAGLVGAGRTEVAKTIFGALPKDEGDIYLFGEKLNIKSPRDAIAKGISLLSEDRKEEGLIQVLRIDTNMMMASQKQFQKAGVFSSQRVAERCGSMGTKLHLNTKNLSLPVSSLSGGNQQKVSLAKWLIGDCKLIILDEPTRGVDVGAKVEIYNIINDLVRQGIGVIMISSELPEILGMSDRIMVLHEGTKTGELMREDATQDIILKYATGQEVSVS